MVKKTLIKVKIDLFKILKGEKENSCFIKVAFPKGMPKNQQEDIKQRINKIIDEIREYL